MRRASISPEKSQVSWVPPTVFQPLSCACFGPLLPDPRMESTEKERPSSPFKDSVEHAIRMIMTKGTAERYSRLPFGDMLQTRPYPKSTPF